MLQGTRTIQRAEDVSDIIDWLVRPMKLGCSEHADAYVKWRNSPLGVTEDVWGILGAWPWRDLEEILAVKVELRDPDPLTWRTFWRALDAGLIGRAIHVADNGTPNTPCSVNGHRGMSHPMWERTQRHKHRHYFDIASLSTVWSGVWEKEGVGGLFRNVAKRLLFEAVRGRLSYERIYLTMFWIWACPYWMDISRYILKTGLLHTSDAQYRMACKETTAQVARSWFFPLTNTQHIASTYFLNAEDLVGYPDADPDAGKVAFEILTFATDHFEYTFPERAAGTRSFDAYLHEFRLAAETLIEPLYARYHDKALSLDEMLETRVAWGATGEAGRRARELLGPEVAPKGAAKAYVLARTEARLWKQGWGTTYVETANKTDERGVTRTIAATDMRDQISEHVAFKAITNKYPEVGLDIGESPAQTMARHINLAVTSERLMSYKSDGRVLMCWDWQAWDHFVHAVERVLILQAMLKMSETYLQGVVLHDVGAELLTLIESADKLVFRSQSYADERYASMVDGILPKAGGRARRLPGYGGRFAIKVNQPNGQQSGRRSTLEGNTLIGTTRLLVRDAELLGRDAPPISSPVPRNMCATVRMMSPRCLTSTAKRSKRFKQCSSKVTVQTRRSR